MRLPPLPPSWFRLNILTSIVVAAVSVSCYRLKSQVAEMRESDTRKLRDEYQRLLQGLDNSAAVPAQPRDLQERGSPLPVGDAIAAARADGANGNGNGNGVGAAYEIPEDLLQQAIPAQIKKAGAFLTFMRAVVEYLKKRLDIREVVLESPQFFLQKVRVGLCSARGDRGLLSPRKPSHAAA